MQIDIAEISDTAVTSQQDRDASVAFVSGGLKVWQKSHPNPQDTPESPGLYLRASSSSPAAFSVPAPLQQPPTIVPEQVVIPPIDGSPYPVRDSDKQHTGAVLQDLAEDGEAAIDQRKSFQEGNRKASSTIDDSVPSKESSAHQQPALYAIIAALGASLGYMGLVAVRCIGLLQEFAPKAPLSEYIAAPRKRFGRDNVASVGTSFSMTRKPRQAARLCLPARQPLRLAARDAVAESRGRGASGMDAATAVPPLPGALNAESSP